MNLALAVFVVVGFAGVLEYLDLPERARGVGKRSQDALAVLQNDSLDDREKEEALQGHARRLFGLLGILGGGSILALGGPLATVWGLERIGIGSFGAVLRILQRLDFLAATIAVGLLGYLLVRFLRPS
ncbi:hypothetical protein GGP72_003133 [Salinibacter ruber]|uniref:Uncharacterized protein n=1 Tax=Salinibacter ruber TaxID=146919 RepID=A0A9X2Q7H9_9BACT|nr:hypothetical protein [Salinibacter ruber]MCS3679165.1 hypothetical protein [Salinibacter ruber]MCS3682471.1 hypothetical protein [Salinibacter ruber]